VSHTAASGDVGATSGQPLPEKRKIGCRPASRLLSLSVATGMVVPDHGRPRRRAGPTTTRTAS